MTSRARKEASAQTVRGYYKQFAAAKHLEYRSRVDNKVFDLIDLRKGRPKILCYRTMGNYCQDSQARQFPQCQGQMGTKLFPRQTKRQLTN